MSIRFAKYFTRNESEDFSDSGNYFRCYDYKGVIRISVCKQKDNGYYIAGKVIGGDFDPTLNYIGLDLEQIQLYEKINEVLNRYNFGCNEEIVDLDSWVKDLDSVIQVLGTVENSTVTIYLNELDNKFYAFKWDKKEDQKDYEKIFSPLLIDEKSLDKFNVKRLVVKNYK